jgi:hypothetical protein
MSKNISSKEFRRGKDERQRLFVSLGLRPLLLAFYGSLFVYVASMVWAVCYYWSQTNLLKWLIMPVVLLLFLAFDQSLYTRRGFRSSAIVVALSLCIEYRRLMFDDFWLIGSLARLMVIAFAVLIYTKMKDPIFSTSNGA